MNLQLLSAEIVMRVHHSPDSVTNLCEVVANLIREEIDRSNTQACKDAFEEAEIPMAEKFKKWRDEKLSKPGAIRHRTGD